MTTVGGAPCGRLAARFAAPALSDARAQSRPGRSVSSGPPSHGGWTRWRCSRPRKARRRSSGSPSCGELCDECTAIARSRLDDPAFPARAHLGAVGLELAREQEEAVLRRAGRARTQVDQWPATDEPGERSRRCALSQVSDVRDYPDARQHGLDGVRPEHVAGHRPHGGAEPLGGGPVRTVGQHARQRGSELLHGRPPVDGTTYPASSTAWATVGWSVFGSIGIRTRGRSCASAAVVLPCPPWPTNSAADLISSR